MKKDIKAVLFDLDGTVYCGDDPIPGAAEFIDRLRQSTIDYLFVTNRGNRTPEEVAEQLRAMGISSSRDNILTSAQVAASHIGPGKRVYVIGETGVEQALNEIGSTVADDNVDAVIVSYDRQFDYEKLLKGLRHIKTGAAFVATNGDAVITLEDGIAPESGPLVAALENASGIPATIMGKPQAAMIDSAIDTLGCKKSECIIIGDNLETDILAGNNAGIDSALILTGVSTRADAAVCAYPPTWIVENYGELEDLLFE